LKIDPSICYNLSSKESKYREGESGLQLGSSTLTEHNKETSEWIGGKFNPEYFNIKEVKFDNPKKRWKIAIASE